MTSHGNATRIDPTHPTGDKDPFHDCISLETLDENVSCGPLDFEPDPAYMDELTTGLETYVPKGTEQWQTNGIYATDAPLDTAGVIRALRHDLADEDWTLVTFRFVRWEDADGAPAGWSILILDLNETGLLRQLSSAYDAVNDAEYGARADHIIDALADGLGDVTTVRSLYARVLAERFHLASLPQPALDMIYNRGVDTYTHHMWGRGEHLSEAMYNAFADYAEFLQLANGKDLAA